MSDEIETVANEVAIETFVVVETVVAEVKNIAHTIELRSFGRPSADHPMVQTTVTGGQ